MSDPSTTDNLKEGASRAVVVVARTGYAARGVIYLLIGGLAMLSTIGHSEGETTDSRGALEHVMHSRGGWIVLIIIGVGLICFSLWRGVQVVLDPDRRGWDFKGIATRTTIAISGAVYGTLAVWSIRRGIGYIDGKGDDRKSWTAWILALPMGRWIIGAVGLAIIGAGLAQIAKGWTDAYRKRLRVRDEWLRWLLPVCRFGLIARGVVFGIIGGFIIYAARSYDAHKARGLSQAFDAMRDVTYGRWLLTITSLGLVAFAVYCFIQARCRQIAPRT